MIGVLSRLLHKGEVLPQVSSKQRRLPGMVHPPLRSLFHGHDQPAPKPGQLLPPGPHGWNPEKGQFVASRGCPPGTVHKWAAGWFRKNLDGDWEPLPHHTGEGGVLDIAERLHGEHLPAGTHITTNGGSEYASLNVPSAGGMHRLRNIESAFHILLPGSGGVGTNAVMDLIVPNTSVRPRDGNAHARDLSLAARDLQRLGGPGFDTQPSSESFASAIRQIERGIEAAGRKFQVPWREAGDVKQVGDGLYLLTEDDASTPIALHLRTIVNRGDVVQSTIAIQVGGAEEYIWAGPAQELMHYLKVDLAPPLDLQRVTLNVADKIAAAYLPSDPKDKLKFAKPKRGKPPAQLTGSWQTSRLTQTELVALSRLYEKSRITPLDPLEHEATFSHLPYSETVMKRLAKDYGYQGEASLSPSYGIGSGAKAAVGAVNMWCKFHHYDSPHMNLKKLLKMVGVPDLFEVTKIETIARGHPDGESFIIKIEADGYEEEDDVKGNIERTLTLHSSGKAEVHNDYFRAPKPRPRLGHPARRRASQGYGTKMLLTQSQALLAFHHAAGLPTRPEVTTFAAGNFDDPTFDGYWVWAHLGYKRDDKGPHGESWEEMLSTPGGAAYWRDRGGGGDAKFDLERGSYSLARLYYYVKDRYFGKPVKVPKGKEKKEAVPTEPEEPVSRLRVRASLQHVSEWARSFGHDPQTWGAVESMMTEIFWHQPTSLSSQRKAREQLVAAGLQPEQAALYVAHAAAGTLVSGAPHPAVRKQADGVSVETVPAPESGGYTDSKGNLHRDAHQRVSFPPLPSGKPVVVRVFSDGSHMSQRATVAQTEAALRMAGKRDAPVAKAGRAPHSDDYDALDRAGRSWCHMIAKRIRDVRSGGGQ